MTFREAVAQGLAAAGDIEDWIDTWHEEQAHDRPLSHALGWTYDEYARWLKDPEAIHDLVSPPAGGEARTEGGAMVSVERVGPDGARIEVCAPVAHGARTRAGRAAAQSLAALGLEPGEKIEVVCQTPAEQG